VAGGRPTKYKDEYAEQAYKFCLLGADDKALARMFDVAVSTIYEWKNGHPEFSEAIKRGGEVADAEVGQSLYHRAMGYSHDEDKIFNANGQPLVVPTTKHYPPDTAAAIYWLNNRRRRYGDWSNKQEIDSNVNLTAKMVEMSDEELSVIAKGEA